LRLLDPGVRGLELGRRLHGGKWLQAREVGLVLRDLVLLDHALEDFDAPLQRTVRVHERIVALGVPDGAGKKRGLAQGELAHLLAPREG
jgi:hypothetical protein